MLEQSELNKRKYAFPKDRKFPMPDKAHVLSAIKFFNYVSPSEEQHLASEILKRMKEYGIKEVNVGPNNRFSKYYKKEDKSMSGNYLKHYAKGQTADKHKYIAIRNGHYIYPKTAFNNYTKRMSDRQRLLLEDKKKLNTEMEGKYLQNAVENQNGKLMPNLFQRNKDEIKEHYKKQADEIDRQLKEISDAKLTNVKKYQESSNYQFTKAVKEFAAKGKSFLNKLFGKDKKPQRTTEQALKINQKLRDNTKRYIYRKGTGKMGSLN